MNRHLTNKSYQQRPSTIFMSAWRNKDASTRSPRVLVRQLHCTVQGEIPCRAHHLSPVHVLAIAESYHIEDACKWLNRMTDGERREALSTLLRKTEKSAAGDIILCRRDSLVEPK